MSIPTLQPEQSDILFNHFVYFNLHNRKWSLKAVKNGPRGRGRVSGHARTIHLMGVTAKVSEAGRLRVIREKRKNVHAGLIGTVCEVVDIETFRITDKTPRIRYNPYQGPHFVDGDGCPVCDEIEHVVLHDGRAYAADALYYAISVDSPTFLCIEDVDDWARETGYSGWVRRNSSLDRYYYKGEFLRSRSIVYSGGTGWA